MCALSSHGASAQVHPVESTCKIMEACTMVLGTVALGTHAWCIGLRCWPLPARAW